MSQESVMTEKSGVYRKPRSQAGAWVRAGQRRRGLWIAVLVLALLAGVGIWNHVARSRAEAQYEAAAAVRVVEVRRVQRESKARELELPGSIEANQVATLYARTNGYLGQWLVDIGDNVKEGQRLAVIETPDVEQQYRQAQSALQQAKANFELARVTAVRWQRMYEQKVVSAEENDQQQGSYQAAAGAMNAAEANERLLEEQLGFNQIVAPFDGRITNRYLDIGALVTAGSGGAGTKIYDLEQTDPLRIYVNVPQTDAPLVKAGVKAKVMVRELPGRDFEATVARTAGAIDPQSRTLLTELLIPNKEGVLYAGMYGELKFALEPDGAGPVIVPDGAFMFRTAGAQVVVVKGGKVHWQTMEVGRDYGTELEALRGVEPGDLVVMNPTDDLEEGMTVKTHEAAGPAK